MRLIAITLILFCCCLFMQAQEMVISGKILNSKSKAPVAYANIGIAGKSLGTVSNDRGEYEFHLPASHYADTLSISCVGFATFSIQIQDIKNLNEFDVFLQAKTYAIGEVVIREKMTAKTIVENAMKRIPNNYINKASLADGFYREYFKENDEFVAFAEASVSIYDDKGYGNVKETSRERVKINELRVSDILNEGDYVLYIDISYALRSNPVRNVGYWEKYAKKTNYHVAALKVDSLSYFDNSLVYCISYHLNSKKRGDYKGRLFIRINDFALLRMEMNATNLKAHELNGAPHKSEAVYIFKEHRDKLYLNYISANHEVSYVVNERNYDLKFYSELTINDIRTDNVIAIPANNKVPDKSIFYQPRYRTFDPDFWTTYNLFEKSPANTPIINDLQIERLLQEQYKANGKLIGLKKKRSSSPKR